MLPVVLGYRIRVAFMLIINPSSPGLIIEGQARTLSLNLFQLKPSIGCRSVVTNSCFLGTEQTGECVQLLVQSKPTTKSNIESRKETSFMM